MLVEVNCVHGRHTYREVEIRPKTAAISAKQRRPYTDSIPAHSIVPRFANTQIVGRRGGGSPGDRSLHGYICMPPTGDGVVVPNTKNWIEWRAKLYFEQWGFRNRVRPSDLQISDYVLYTADMPWHDAEPYLQIFCDMIPSFLRRFTVSMSASNVNVWLDYTCKTLERYYEKNDVKIHLVDC